MKILAIPLIAAAALFQQCNRVPATTKCYKGRLEVKALCSNYTIAILDGSIDTSLVEAAWTDESTGKQYQNVFALGSPCSFPDSIQQGQEFYFTLAEKDKDCAVCMAYYPKPAKALSIKVLDKPCR
ncbi:MAG: hypothetical protein EOO14_06845 [Chitinophagaceae bacterium]|nr:MAG: hypothetical protein EOO14_06845 [Chitinophagaceae bacterium]